MARGSWGQSKLLTQKSWAIVRENRYLLVFPALGFILCLVPLAVFWVPAGYLALNNQNVAAIGLAIIGLFANQLVLAISGGGLVAAADTELSGGNSSVGHGLARAVARLIPLLGWSLISTVVNTIVGFIRNRGGGAASAVTNLAAAGVLAMWQIVTFFVLPFIMLEGRGPISAIKDSFALFKAKWGVQIFGGVRIGGLIGLATIVPGVILVILGFVLVFTDLAGVLALGIVLIAIGILVFMIGALLISTMRGIFSVVLFRYAQSGTVEGGFTEAELAGAIRTSR